MPNRLSIHAADLLAQLRQEKVTLWEDAGNLRYRAPQGRLSEQHLQLLKEHKNELLDMLRTEAGAMTIIADQAARFAPFPLTDVQSAYLLGRRGLFDYGDVACHIYLEMNYAALDPERAEQVWNMLVLRHDMLRVVIDDNGQQRVLESVPPWKLAYTDTSAWAPDQAQAKLDEIRSDMGHRIYDTNRWPLFDLAITRTWNEAILHLSMDFLVADWASIWLLLSEFETLYRDAGRRLPQPDIRFRDYVLAERSWRNSAAYAADKTYWSERIDTLPAAPDLPLAVSQNHARHARFRRRVLHLDAAAWEALKQRAQKKGMTPTAVVLSAYAAVLERWSRSRTFCLNLTLLNRPQQADLQQIVGDFTSVSLLQVDCSDNLPFAERARALQKQLFEDLDHRLYSGVETMREIARRRGRDAALMPFVFTSAIGLVGEAQSDGLQGRIGDYGISQTPQVFIDCQAMDSPNGLQVNWDVREGVFPDGMADDMFDSFEQLLDSLAQTTTAWDSAEALPLPNWQLAQRQRMNATQSPLPAGLLHERVWAQAAASPDRPAVIDSENRWTYSELVQRAAAVTEKLREAGCARQERVAIVMDKSAHQAAAVLGVLAAGAVYVPIDAKQPELRRLAMLEQADIRLVLTCSTTALPWPDTVAAIETDRLPPSSSADATASGMSPDLPAYVIYTSGSTGLPKGVVISHRAAANTIEDMNRRFGVNADDRVLGLAQLSFDLSVYDMFGPLSTGGAVVYPPAGSTADPSQWAAQMRRHAVTVWNSTPASMQMLVDYLQSEPQLELPELRLALLSGDWIPLTLPDKLARRLPAAQLISLGGATEAAIWSIYHVYQGLEPDWKSIPYGRPLANQGFRVLDAGMRDCPVWAIGELYISGDGLAIGYLGDKETTERRFIVHPADGQRLYRTGDLGRYLPGGEIEFLGREDHQVKIRGHRIELGEIEATLLKHPAVAAAAVVVDGSGDDKALLAVVELARPSERDKTAEQVDFEQLTGGIDQQAEALANDLDQAAIARAVAQLDQAVFHAMLDALLQLGAFAAREPLSADEICQRAGIVPAFHWLVRRWLCRLAECGLLTAQPGDGERYSCPRKPEAEELSRYWQQAEAAWTNKLSSEGFMTYVRSNAEQLPNLLGGRQDPVALLFPEGKLDYVRSLYVEHLMANYLNFGICTLLKRIAERHTGRKLRVLEVGAGTGATTEQALRALSGFEVDYSFTDVSSFFIPGAKARFSATPGVRFGLFDVDQDYRAQGLAPNSYDIVLAAGVLENARDIPASMNRLSELISPGGWLVFTEPTHEHAWILISQAFMMMEPGDDLRTDTSYLDRDGWVQLLEQLGDEPVMVLPEDGHKLSALGFHLFAKRCKQDRVPATVAELSDFLAQRLPTPMLPSHLQMVDALPLTVNGKLDRRQLAGWRPKLVGEQADGHVQEESADELEAMLAQVWAEVLSIPGIGRTQSFYDFGADSLLMAQAAGKLRDKLAAGEASGGIPFDALLRQMLNYPTIAALAAFIRNHAQAAQAEAEQPLHAPSPQAAGRPSNAVLTPYGGGETGPLRVVFHAVFGTMNCYRHLLERMAAQRVGPVLGVTIADTQTYCAHDARELVEEVADDYAQLLLETGHKEMQLIGYSLGGLIAIEVARRLMEQGVQVADLVLIDIHPVLFEIDDELVIESLFLPNLKTSLAQTGFGEIAQEELNRGLLQTFQLHQYRMPQGASLAIGGDPGLDQVGELFRRLASLSLEERLAAYVRASAQASGEPMQMEMAANLFRLFGQSFKAARYTPQPYMGNIRFLLAAEPFGFLPETEQMTLDFWQDVCLGDLQVISIAGNHFNCLEEETYVADWARVIAAPLGAQETPERPANAQLS